VERLAGPRTWLARAAFAVVGLAVAVLAFFFLAVALMIGAVVVLVFAVRWWWLVRKVKAARAAAGPLEGEYSVVDPDKANDRLR
jgi:membrane protein implicated in regulation of membrane protease activity